MNDTNFKIWEHKFIHMHTSAYAYLCLLKWQPVETSLIVDELDWNTLYKNKPLKLVFQKEQVDIRAVESTIMDRLTEQTP